MKVLRWMAPALALLLWASPGLAQDEARALFERGVSAFDGGDLGEAEVLFRRSLEIRRSGAAAFNLARVLERTGRLAEATLLFREVLTMPGVPPEIGAQVGESLARVAPRLSHLTIRGPADAEARVDGERVPIGEDVVLDPGQHSLLVQHRGATVLDETLSLAAGERRTVEAAPSPSAAAATVLATAPAEAEPGEADTGSDDTWIWIVVSVAAALLIGGGIAIGVAVGSQPACEGNVEPGCIRAGLGSF